MQITLLVIDYFNLFLPMYLNNLKYVYTYILLILINTIHFR